VLLLIGAGVLLGLDDAFAQKKIKIDGSTGTLPLVEALAKAFSVNNPVEFEFGKGLGTKARLDALKSGAIDIAMASHGLNVAQVTADGMNVHRIATTPVVFAVNQTVTIDGLSGAQICAIYDGKIRDWREAGGPALPVAPLARPESEVDTEVIRASIGCFKELKLANHVALQARAGDMAKALSETAGGIGITSATIVGRSGGKIKAIALDGLSASESNVRSGAYKLTRDAFLVARNSAPAEVTGFLDFVRSPRGAEIIRTSGAISTGQ
jgi:phosphate transport system substrate-binding protein